MLLEYESYFPLAHKTLSSLANSIFKRYHLEKLLVIHRLGQVPIEDASLLVIASGKHRKEPMQAVEELVELIKAQVPIWKKEFYEDGSCWKGNVECPWGQSKCCR